MILLIYFLSYILTLLPFRLSVSYKKNKWSIIKKDKQLLYDIGCNNGSMLFKRKHVYFSSINKFFFLKNNIKKKYKKNKNKYAIYLNKMGAYDENYIKYLKKYVIDQNVLQQTQNNENFVEDGTEKLDLEKKIELSIGKEEKELFDLLKKVNETYKLKSTLRVVGGWVRDKHLKIINNDIDITIDNMNGNEFCKYIKMYLQEKEKKKFNFGIIKINSDQSKHLETSSFNLLNFQVDIVNLRSEKYTEISRIPQIVIGTPEEDAYRRDFTINSLFYNLENYKIEDFTKKGIFHLKNKIISTPLEPLTTFLDDPLRIIRCIRFCGFFDFYIEKSIFDVLKNKQIKDAFSQKISKSRLSAELIKVFSKKCKNIVFCLTLLNYSSYSSLIFQLPENYFIEDQSNHLVPVIEEGNKKRKGSSLIAINTPVSGEMFHETERGTEEETETNKRIHIEGDKWGKKKVGEKQKEHMEKWIFHGLQYVSFFKENENKILKEYFPNLDYKDSADFLNLCIFFLPLHNYFYRIKQSKIEYATDHIIKESMKLPLKYSKFCTYIFDGFIYIQELYKNKELVCMLKKEEQEEIEKTLYLKIKADVILFLKKLGDKWDLLLFIFYIFQKCNETEKNCVPVLNTNKQNNSTINIDMIENITNLSDFALKLYNFIIKNNIGNSYKIKPFLKWPDIRNHFPKIPSNYISEVYDQIVRYMVIHGENKEDCIEYLKKYFKKYT